MLDINLFRKEKGGDPELVRNSQRSRFESVELVDEVIVLDEAWRQSKNSSRDLPQTLRIRGP
jgi:seryl-tRNA synthetase